MKRILMVCMLISGLAGLAQTEPVVDAPAAVAAPETVEAVPFTARDARASVQEAVDFILKVNSALSDDYFHSGEWDKCVGVFDRMIALAPDNINYYANAAWLMWSTEQLDRAMTYYGKMIENNPTNPDAYYTVGHYYFFTRRDYATALTYLEEALQNNGPVMQRHLYAHCLAKLGRTAEALAAWEKILADEPNDATAKQEIEKLKAQPAPAAEEPAGAERITAPAAEENAK